MMQGISRLAEPLEPRRLLSARDGMIDTHFGSGGIATARLGQGTQFAAWEVLASGKIMAVGQAPGSRIAAARWNADGSLDKTFDGDGIRLITLPSGYSPPSRFDIDGHDGRFIGYDNGIVDPNTGSKNDPTPHPQAIFYFSADGTLNRSFAGDGIYDLNTIVPPTAAAIGIDGRVFMALGSDSKRVVALSARGPTDLNYGTRGQSEPASAGISSIQLLSGGKLLITKCEYS
jgi:hypothetical protein